MAGTVKGITVEIGGDTNGLTKALSKVKREIDSTQKELKDVDKLLKFDPKNTELLAQKQQLLAKQTDTVKDKLEGLKKAKKQCDDEMKNGTEINQYQYRKLQREIAQTEQDLKELTIQSSKFTAAGEKISAVGNKMTDIGKKGMAASAAVVGLGAACIKNASDMEESMNKVDVAFKDNADTVKKWSDTTLESYGISKGSALEMSSLFGDMGTAMGIPTDKAADMSMSLVGLAGDLSSFKNVSQEVAQNALKGIFTGEGESLKSLGVIMQDATLQEYALANGYKKKYSEMTQSEKVQLRYNYVMEQTKNAQGDFARTSDGTANSTRIFTESLKQLSAEIGEKLLPIITPIIQKLTEIVQWFSQLSDGQQKVIVIIGSIIAILPPLLILLGSLITSVGAITAAWGKCAVAVKIATDAHISFNTVLKAIPYVAAAAAITAVVVALLSYKTAAEKVMEAHDKVIKSIDETAKSEMTEAEKAMYLKNRLYELEDQIKSGTLSDKEATKAKEEYSSIANQLNNMIPGIINNIGNESNAYAIQRGEVDALTQSFYDLAYAKAMANAYQAKIEQTAKDLLEVQEKKKKYAPSGVDSISAAPKSNIIDNITTYFSSKKALEESKKLSAAEKKLTDEMNGYISELANYQKQAAEKTTSTVTNEVGKQTQVVSAGNKKNTASTKSASKAQSSALEKQYEKELRDLKYKHEVGEISEEEYYTKLSEYRDKYFSVGSKEWQDYTVEIHNYIESQKKDIESLYDEMAENAISKLDEIATAQKTLSDKLKGYGNLYNTITNTYKGIGEGGRDVVETKIELADLSKDIATLQEYKNILMQIRDKGVPQGFFEVLRGLSVEDGIAFGKELLNTPDDAFNAYISDWQQKQNLSDSISKELYGTEMYELTNEIGNEFENMQDDFAQYGIDSADEWCSGFINKLEEMQSKIKAAMSEIIFNNDTLDIQGNLRGLGSSTTNNTSYDNRSTNVTINNSGGNPSAYEQRQQINRVFNQLQLQGVL